MARSWTVCWWQAQHSDYYTAMPLVSRNITLFCGDVICTVQFAIWQGRSIREAGAAWRRIVCDRLQGPQFVSTVLSSDDTLTTSRRVQMVTEDTPVWRPRHCVTFSQEHCKSTIYKSSYLLTYLLIHKWRVSLPCCACKMRRNKQVL